MIVLFPWGLTALLLALLFIDRRRLLDGWASRRWVPCNATILDVQDAVSFIRTESQYRGSGQARVASRAYRYRYEVSGMIYESWRYSFEHEPQEDMPSFEIGETISAYHDPADPRRAVIRRGLTWRSWWLPWLTIGLLLWNLTVASLAKA